MDLCPSFGCRQSGGSHQRVSNAVVYLMQKNGFKTLAHVDDFCGVGSTRATAAASFAKFEDTTTDLGLELAKEKTVRPTQRLEFLGLYFDTVDLTITIPEVKLREVVDEAACWRDRTAASKQEVQSLAGKLNFISLCVSPGRKFLARILAALRAAEPGELINITTEVHKDLNWFVMFASACNRRVMFSPKLNEFVIECDACLQGSGGFSSTHYYHAQFTSTHTARYHISQLEALNIVQALKSLTPHHLTNARVVVHTDNIAAMYALNTGRTKDVTLAACAREIRLFAAFRQLDILVAHVPGVELVLADALSRKQFTQLWISSPRPLLKSVS